MHFEHAALAHKNLITQYTCQYGENSCQFSFPAMYCLHEKYGDEICETDGWLFIHRSGRDNDAYRTYLFPLGNGHLENAISHLTDDARSHSALIRFETLTAAQKARLDAACPGRFIGVECRDMAEYLYERERLVSLSGHSLTTKRYESRVFWRDLGTRSEIIPIEPTAIPLLREFQTQWLNTRRGDESWPQLLHEDSVISQALSHFAELGLEGVYLRVDGRVRGFVYGSRLSPDCLDMMAEKGDRRLLGAYTVLSQQFAERCGEGCRYVNWEEDVASPGLRQAKMSYKPDLLLQKYVISEVKTD